MNPYNRPRIVNANIWDKDMADAFSLTHPYQKSSEFDLMNSQLNPESVLTVFPADGYSNFSADVVVKCNLKYPPPRGNKRKPKYQQCLRDEQKIRDEKKASGGAGGILGIGSGRRKLCKEQGLSGVEKRECARELKARGWRKGQPMPADMAGITPEDVEEEYVETPQTDSETDTTNDDSSDSGNGGGKFLDDKAKKILIYTGITVAGILGIIAIAWGVKSAVKSPSPSIGR